MLSQKETKYSETMQSNNTFDIARFGMLCRQTLVHQYKLVITSVVAFCGGLFILLLLIQVVNGFDQSNNMGKYFELLIFVFVVTGVICSGTSFPSLRSREKMHNFLMLPASTFEKFLLEFIGRILIFIMILPVVYWAVYNIEGYIVNVFYPSYSFGGISFFSNPHLNFGTETANQRVGVLIFTGGLSIFIIPFLGAAAFNKNPLVKTVFFVAIIFFFNLFMVYFFLEVLNFREYHPTTPILFMRDAEDALLVSIVASIIFNAGFMVAAYFKIKEREV